MKAVAVVEPNKVELVELDRPQVGPYQALVRTEAAYLCNSTDGKLVAGKFPGIDSYPLVLGHEDVGIVEEVGQMRANFNVGDRAIGGLVFEFSDPKFASGWGGFCEYTLVNDHDAMVADRVASEDRGWFECYEIQRPVDPDIPLKDAGLLCTWREVYGGFGDFDLQPGHRIVVFGAGPVGLSFAKFGKLLGLELIVMVDPLAHKRDKALTMGADEAIAPDGNELRTLVERHGKFDAVVDAVGSGEIVNTALPMIKMGGSICVYGVISDPRITVNKGDGPYNFNLYMHQWPTRWREKEAQEPLCQWIREGKLTADDFITHEFPIQQINDALQAVRNGEVIKCLLTY